MLLQAQSVLCHSQHLHRCITTTAEQTNTISWEGQIAVTLLNSNRAQEQSTGRSTFCL